MLILGGREIGETHRVETETHVDGTGRKGVLVEEPSGKTDIF